MKVFLLTLSFLALTACPGKKENLQPIAISYPSSGTIINAQVGLIFEKTDILKKHGLSGSLKPLATGREMKVALVSGAADVILTSEANLVVLLGEGFDARAIGSLGSAGRLALVTDSKSPYKSLADLKGKSIATIFGTSLHRPAMAWAKEAGGAEVVNMSQIGAMMAALAAGKVDAVMTWDPFLEEAVAKDQVRILKQENFDLISVASGKFADAHPGSVKALDECFREAIVYLTRNKTQVNGWFSEMSKISPEVIDRSSQENKNYGAKDAASVNLAVSESYRARLAATGEFLFDGKVIRRKPDWNKAFGR